MAHYFPSGSPPVACFVINFFPMLVLNNDCQTTQEHSVQLRAKIIKCHMQHKRQLCLYMHAYTLPVHFVWWMCTAHLTQLDSLADQ